MLVFMESCPQNYTLLTSERGCTQSTINLVTRRLSEEARSVPLLNAKSRTQIFPSIVRPQPKSILVILPQDNV